MASGGKNKIMHSGLAVSFFPAFIALVVIFLFNEYKTAQLPTLNEEMLMNGAEYCLVTDLNEIGDADYAYEIKKRKLTRGDLRNYIKYMYRLKRGR